MTRNQERFIAATPPAIAIAAIAVMVLALSGATLAAQLAASAIAFVAALAWLWLSRAEWREWDAGQKAFSVCLGGLLAFGAFAVPALAALAGSESAWRWPLMVLGMALVVSCAILFLRGQIRAYDKD